jgi:hypothetical protein
MMRVDLGMSVRPEAQGARVAITGLLVALGVLAVVGTSVAASRKCIHWRWSVMAASLTLIVSGGLCGALARRARSARLERSDSGEAETTSQPASPVSQSGSVRQLEPNASSAHSSGSQSPAGTTRASRAASNTTLSGPWDGMKIKYAIHYQPAGAADPYPELDGPVSGNWQTTSDAIYQGIDNGFVVFVAMQKDQVHKVEKKHEKLWLGEWTQQRPLNDQKALSFTMVMCYAA